jgi:hypothetical protein
MLTGRGGDSFEGPLNRSWLDICRSQHAACNNTLECIRDGPSRLLDLQAFDNSGDIRLVDCKTWTEMPRVSTFPTFVCLSHCWGEPSVRPKMTRKSTLLKHLERISLDELSRTFQDAIHITRQLQGRYLWNNVRRGGEMGMDGSSTGTCIVTCSWKDRSVSTERPGTLAEKRCIQARGANRDDERMRTVHFLRR